MINSLPIVVSLFYITAGYMLVAGATAAAVMAVARTFNDRVAYGALAILSLSGVGYQISTVLYYQAATLSIAQQALIWQMDFASIGLISAYLFIAFESVVRQNPIRILTFAGVLAVAMIVGNRLSPYSLHFDAVEQQKAFTSEALAGLVSLQASPGLGTRVWYGTIAVVLVWGLGVAHSLWRQVSVQRALFMICYIFMLFTSVAVSLLIDWDLWQGIYPVGFALAIFVLIMSMSMVVESARRSQQLFLRDREMKAEIGERRRAEDKLLRISQVFMQEPAPIQIVDVCGETLQVNRESIRFLHRNVSDVPRVNFLDVLSGLDVDRDALIARLSAGESCEFGSFYFTAGVPVADLFFVKDSWIIFKLYPIFNQNNTLEEFVVRLEDVTDRQFVDNAINTISNAVSTETGQAFFQRLVVYLARLLNKKYVFIGVTEKVDADPHLVTLAAAVDGELIDNFNIKVKDSPLEIILQNGAYAVERRAHQDFSWQHILKKLNVQSYVGVAIHNESRVVVGALMVMDVKPMEHIDKIQDVVKIFVSRAGSEFQRVESEKTIRKMAFEDHLTGLPNRAELNEYVGNQFKDDTKAGAFIQLDLDHFKTINDALGHNIGDQVIRQLGKRLKNNAGKDMFIARIGGDEFAVVVTNLGEDADNKAHQVAQRISALMEHPVEVGDHLLDVGCTMGIVVFPDYAKGVIDVFRHADIALHKAKSAGRGSIQMFTPVMRDDVSRRISLEKGLRLALQNDELQLYYQAQVDGVGNLIGAEVLVRWLHPTKGMIPPSVFIPVAEETGLINPMGEWIFNTALKARKAWYENKVPFVGHLSINVSAWQFARPDFVSEIHKAIETAEVPPSFITLEITETAVLSDVKDTINKMAELRRSGVTIALDDFGTGYSSLAYLRDLPLDILKIDKAFVDVLEIHQQEPLVESMISIGKHMGLQVIAEGVETSLQLERLKALGCNAYQGYLFAKPLAEADFLQWLQRFDEHRVQPNSKNS